MASRAPPSGTVTLLFTDIEGSTQRWERDRAAMQDAVRRHDAILRAVIEAHGGHVFKTTGDGFCAAFARAEDAVASALEAQRGLGREDFLTVDGLRVRMALHSGTTEERDGDYFGPTVHRVARLLAVGHGGQVLLSQATTDLVRGQLPNGANLLDLGRHRLKDLSEPASVHQLLAPELAHEFPPLRSLGAQPNNLPLQLTSFIGREAELSETKRRFEESRLLTLAGTGGVGKTRLAVQLAADLSDRFADGLWFIDLAPLTDAMFISTTVLATMGVREAPGRDTDDRLASHLRDKSALLLLDNCEHLIAGVAVLVDRLLHECPRLHLIATSREVLDITGEEVFRVTTFDEDDGVALFASRARAVAQSFALTPENRETVTQICKRLDGIALAIEMAAARVKMMSVQELQKHLDDRFRLLTGGSRTALPRQQTLRGLIDWSYNLLDESEKVLLRRLAIFAGEFSLEAVTTICGADSLEEFEVLDLISHLINKSLVQFEQSGGRYWLLESTKEFARERLREAGEWEAMQRLRARHVASIAETAYAARGTPRWEELRAEIARDYEEYRAALQWTVGEQSDVALGAALAGALRRFWSDTGRVREGRFWLERVLEHEAELSDAEKARVLQGLTNQYFAQGEYARMEGAARRTEAAYAALGDRNGQARAWTLLALAVYSTGRFEEAEDLLQRALAVHRELGNRRNEAVQLNDLAELVAEWKCDYAQAERLYAQAVVINREIGNSFNTAVTLSDWSQTAAYQNEFERAGTLLHEALAIFRELGNEIWITEALVRLGHYAVWTGDCDGARAPMAEAVTLLAEFPHPLEIARCAEATADLALALHEAALAATFLGFSDAFRAAQNLSRPTARQTRFNWSIAKAREGLGDGAFAKAWEDGRALSCDSALALAAPLLNDVP